jgi:hypothetical protein
MNDFIDLWRRYSPSTVLVGRSKLKLGLDISRRSGGRIRSSMGLSYRHPQLGGFTLLAGACL